MGGMNSCCLPQKFAFKDGEHSSSFSSSRYHGRNFSAAFNLSSLGDEGDNNQGLININNSTEEELMTLPGINRSIAQNIIEYRCRIGGFKKIEDLALVSGVGAAKLSVLRQEICVSTKKGSSHDSSPCSSSQDVNSNEHCIKDIRCSNSSNQLHVNVNIANVFQLMKIKGIDQTVAENIVSYRDKKGHYKTIEDLLKVKSISAGLLGAIRHNLILSDTGSNTAVVSTTTNRTRSTTLRDSHTNDYFYNLINKDTDMSSLTKHDDSLHELIQLLGPLAKKSVRPKVQSFPFKRNNISALRIATWNLDGCSFEKISNPGVCDVICMTVLENGLGLLAFQEITDMQALKKICDELNHPRLSNVRKWKGRNRKWEYVMANPNIENVEHSGFIYDVEQGIKLTGTNLQNIKPSQECPFECQALSGFFQVKNFHFIFVNVYHKLASIKDFHKENHTGHMINILHNIKNISTEENHIIIFGNLDVELGLEVKELLQEHGYIQCVVTEKPSMLPLELNRSVSQPHLKRSNSSYNSSVSLCSHLACSKTMAGNIWFNKNSKHLYTGYNEIISKGLTNILIPNGWSWGGAVSKYYPAWAEFYTENNLSQQCFTPGLESIRFTLTD
ncbi:endonuclease/exonuclease/phosphatase family domain-containing protein 1 [Octopus bimaculoides]|nr:endonuclease/exonuclease/phosphatase family domain-containing protein 1 [Octopus bimaculoides]XP_052824239.1 endonuclease/exonuclease/phosphatase family domain-containing protein 1 [Octopus bimaculoides]XP_052824240.1 endonuclease/exonuclease/phosphatase family domain-containing protein 1 [Octopus bimaculoides]